jgi:hypothetical protein
MVRLSLRKILAGATEPQRLHLAPSLSYRRGRVFPFGAAVSQ